MLSGTSYCTEVVHESVYVDANHNAKQDATLVTLAPFSNGKNNFLERLIQA